MTTTRRNRWIGWAAAFLVVAAGLRFLPLFHVVPLQTTRDATAAASFDAEAFVEKLWGEALLQPELRTVDASKLLQLLREKNADAAALGRRLGLSRTTCYFIAGTGRIVYVTNDSVSLALEGEAAPSVVIETGPVFGNAIRDGSGLLDVSAFPNSQDFNAISTALNRRVEEQVLPQLRAKALIGARVRFVGATEVNDPDSALPLRVVPIRIESP
jgi:predicted lipoprotein